MAKKTQTFTVNTGMDLNELRATYNSEMNALRKSGVRPIPFKSWFAIHSIEGCISPAVEAEGVMTRGRASTVSTHAPAAKQATGPNKREQALAIFKKYGAKLARKDVMEKFIGIGLTPAGASTYYQSFRSAS